MKIIQFLLLREFEFLFIRRLGTSQATRQVLPHVGCNVVYSENHPRPKRSILTLLNVVYILHLVRVS